MFGATSPNFSGFTAKGPLGAPFKPPRFVRLGDHEANLYGAGQVMEHPPGKWQFFNQVRMNILLKHYDIP